MDDGFRWAAASRCASHALHHTRRLVSIAATTTAAALPLPLQLPLPLSLSSLSPRSSSHKWTSTSQCIQSTPSGRPVWATAPSRSPLDPETRARTKPLEVIALGNLAVYAAWKVARLRPVLNQHAMTSTLHMRSGLYHTLLTSTWSHMGLLHLAANMISLGSFSYPLLVQGMSHASFWGLYTASGLAGSVLSTAVNRVRRIATPSLGASGAVFGVLTYYLLHNPHSGALLMGVVELSAQQMLITSVVLNLLLAASVRRVRVDGTAHLGGMLAGWMWYTWDKRSSTSPPARVRRRSVPPPSPSALPVPPPPSGTRV